MKVSYWRRARTEFEFRQQHRNKHNYPRVLTNFFLMVMSFLLAITCVFALIIGSVKVAGCIISITYKCGNLILIKQFENIEAKAL